MSILNVALLVNSAVGLCSSSCNFFIPCFRACKQIKNVSKIYACISSILCLKYFICNHYHKFINCYILLQISILFQNFYKTELNKEEMYIRYIHKLYDLHLKAQNFTGN